MYEIGGDSTGTIALGNSGWGVKLYSQSSGNTIGGTTAGSPNVIGANAGDGIVVSDGSGGVLVEGNSIGSNATGSVPLGNALDGVFFVGGLSNSTIGGLVAGAVNIIANNEWHGVAVGAHASDPCMGNAILSNSIYGNAALGIDLGSDGVTAEYPGRAAIRARTTCRTTPCWIVPSTSGQGTTIRGTLNDAQSTVFTLQFLSDPTADLSGHGQGRTLLGTITVTIDGSGNASFTATFSTSVAAGQVVSATATDPDGNTSEFSQDVAVVAGLVTAIAVWRRPGPATRPGAIVAGTVQDGGVAPFSADDLDIH